MFLLLAGNANIVSAQVTPPAAVKASFRQSFPGITRVKWEKETRDEYEASFSKDGHNASASFSPAGKWLETEMGIATSSTPKVVLDAFFAKFPGAKIGQVYKIESASEPVYFELEYVLKGKTKEAKFNAEGKSK